ncbi:hypothetical protein [Thalassomonas sp. M1454]|uniref:hypothetical protein n=1 Tax=Thalassomonas sp. M1454 TaxID=2594477 RepID=UPI00117D108A|nr:hypothetical protein [Thalassomonas sp. M1454]TRX56706.1 hypothetical protein FNN08_04035 [Thalassomonas sp. M1454]
MSKNTFVDRYFKIEIDEHHTNIYLKDISWPEPFTPQESIKLITTLPKDSNEQAINQAIEDIIKNEEYFLTCSECNELNLSNHMFDNLLCKACANNNHGEVF